MMQIKRVLLLSVILTLSLNITYAANHYVYKNATGSNNGTSWANAWKELNLINWASVQSGDNIFIGQGIYTTLLHVQKSGVVIKRSSEAGYNGIVKIDATNITTLGGTCIYVPVENVTIDGLDSAKFILQHGKVSNMSVYQVKNFSFKNATLKSTPSINPQQAFGIYIYGLGSGGAYQHGNILFENLAIVQDSGSYAGNGDADGISGGFIDGITIRNCIIIRQNSDNSPHTDNIQFYTSKNITIENSIIKHLNAGSTANKQAVYLQDCYGEIRIRNNYVEYGQPGGQNALWNRIDNATWMGYMGGLDSMIVTNNTIKYTNGAGDGIGFANNLGANFKGRGICKNNIVVAVNVRLDTTFFDYAHRNNITNNVYYNPAGGNTQISHGYSCYGTWGQSWQTWTANGYDANSYQTNPQLTGYIPASPNVIDKGINLSSLGYNNDIIKQTRTGNWDIGAYEKITGGGGNNPPNQPSNPSPSNGALNQPVSLTLTWNCTDPNGDPLTYDIYFGTSNNPPFVSGNQSNTNFNPAQLIINTTYYWKIVAKDNQGAATSGPIWSFTTAAQMPGVSAKLKLYLDGPYTINEMTTDLSINSMVPLTQPYSEAPWNYNGSEVVSVIPQNTVDWILIELRTSTSPSSIVSRRAAFLRNDGIVVELNGEDKITFPGTQNGYYYIVVYHRNHLAIMTKNPILLSDSASLYDFTTTQEKAYGDQAMKFLGVGKYGMYSADGDASGAVNETDYKFTWKLENGTLGYKKGDYDLNGGINIRDRNEKWKPNKDKITSVPMN